jgi:hypothetical protein
MMADILVRFVGIPMKDGKLTNEQSQLLVAIVLPSAPEIGEVVMINNNDYKVVRRRGDINTATTNDTSSLIGEPMVKPTLHLNVYLRYAY